MPRSSWHPGMRALASVTIVAAVCGASAACATSHATDASPDATAPAPHGRPNLITHDELATVYDRNAYQAIQALRPAMLKDRGATSILLDTPTRPEVYVDGMYYGRFSTLQQIQASDCWEIRYLNVGDATIRYGPGHAAGVIDITTKH